MSDQADRRHSLVRPTAEEPGQRDRLVARDRVRRRRALEWLAGADSVTRDEWLCIGLLFLHGGEALDFAVATAAALSALAAGDSEAASLAARSLDRMLVSMGRDQMFGSQGQVGTRVLARRAWLLDRVSGPTADELRLHLQLGG